MALIATGFLFGRNELTGFNFDPSKPYAGCRICGKVYQPPFAESNDVSTELALNLWRGSHNKTHSEMQHKLLIASGRTFTPEAAQRLSQYGIIDLGGLVIDDEVSHALRVVNARPTDDAEGVAE
jgi:hypothetical protein